MAKFHEELLKGQKWVALTLLALIIVVGLWLGVAWSLGWFTHRFFDLSKFGPQNYISFGSSMLVFTFIIQVITVIFTAWGLISWGKVRGLYGKKELHK